MQIETELHYNSFSDHEIVRLASGIDVMADLTIWVANLLVKITPVVVRTPGIV